MMDIEKENLKYIRNTFDYMKNISGSNCKTKINYDIIKSVLEHRAEFGITPIEDLKRHHNATKKYVRTVNYNDYESSKK